MTAEDDEDARAERAVAEISEAVADFRSVLGGVGSVTYQDAKERAIRLEGAFRDLKARVTANLLAMPEKFGQAVESGFDQLMTPVMSLATEVGQVARSAMHGKDLQVAQRMIGVHQQSLISSLDRLHRQYIAPFWGPEGAAERSRLRPRQGASMVAPEGAAGGFASPVNFIINSLQVAQFNTLHVNVMFDRMAEEASAAATQDAPDDLRQEAHERTVRAIGEVKHALERGDPQKAEAALKTLIAWAQANPAAALGVLKAIGGVLAFLFKLAFPGAFTGPGAAH